MILSVLGVSILLPTSSVFNKKQRICGAIHRCAVFLLARVRGVHSRRKNTPRLDLLASCFVFLHFGWGGSILLWVGRRIRSGEPPLPYKKPRDLMDFVEKSRRKIFLGKCQKMP